MIRRVVGLDLSLTSSGIARITAETRLADVLADVRDGLGTERIDVRRSVTKAPPANLPLPQRLAARSLRLRRAAGVICTLCSGADLVVVEGPAYASDVGKAHDRSGLWWLVVARLTANRIPVVEVTPAQLKLYALGKGSGAETDKEHVLAAVIRRYLDVNVTGNDEADALILAAMGARHLGFPIEPTLPEAHLHAMTKVAWPN
jgi:crossover junction endodeoxyribonuclease RuvC